MPVADVFSHAYSSIRCTPHASNAWRALVLTSALLVIQHDISPYGAICLPRVSCKESKGVLFWRMVSYRPERFADRLFQGGFKTNKSSRPGPADAGGVAKNDCAAMLKSLALESSMLCWNEMPGCCCLDHALSWCRVRVVYRDVYYIWFIREYVYDGSIQNKLAFRAHITFTSINGGGYVETRLRSPPHDIANLSISYMIARFTFYLSSSRLK